MLSIGTDYTLALNKTKPWLVKRKFMALVVPFVDVFFFLRSVFLVYVGTLLYLFMVLGALWMGALRLVYLSMV